MGAGQTEVALLTFQQELEVGSNRDPASILETIGWLELSQDRPQQALERFREGLRLCPPGDLILRGDLLRRQVDALEHLGRLTEALALKRSILAALQDDPQMLAIETSQAADLEEKVGHLSQAQALHLEALRLADSAYSVPVEVIRVITRAISINGYYRFLSAHGRSDEALALAVPFVTAELRTSHDIRIVYEMAVRLAGDLCQRGRLDEARLLLAPAQQNAKLAALVRASTTLARYPGVVAVEPVAGQTADQERSAYFEALARVRAERPDLDSNLLLSSTGADALRAHLSPGQLLVGYFPLGTHLVVLGLERRGLHQATIELDCDRLLRQCRDWHDALAAGRSGDPALVASLRSQLVEPVAPWLKDGSVHQLLLTMQGELWYVPMELLLGSSLGVARATPGDLLHVMEGAWAPFQAGPALAFGAPDAADLPGAREELQRTARQVPGCQLVVGDQASRERFLRLAPQEREIHLATHSFADAQNPLKGYLMLADGQLTLSDVYGLRLERSPLVVLSSCCSGLGQSAPGSEPISLATAFSAAGASRVVSALWPVDDQETRELFGSFYAELGRGRTPLQALQAAQAAARTAHPGGSNWAAFVLSGCPD